MDYEAARARKAECDARKSTLGGDGLPENAFRASDGREWQEPLDCNRDGTQYSKTLRNAKATARRILTALAGPYGTA